MSPKQPPMFPVLEVAAFVDASTVVVIGEGTDDIQANEELYILGQGFSIIPKLNIPLIAPKAKVIATFLAGKYVLAKTPLQPSEGLSITSKRMLEAFGGGMHRPALNAAESSFLGDPGTEPVKVGDPVVRVGDLGAYIQWRTAPD